jgi:hypothetical protein
VDRDDGPQPHFHVLNEDDLFMFARIHLCQDVHFVGSSSIRRRLTAQIASIKGGKCYAIRLAGAPP